MTCAFHLISHLVAGSVAGRSHKDSSGALAMCANTPLKLDNLPTAITSPAMAALAFRGDQVAKNSRCLKAIEPCLIRHPWHRRRALDGPRLRGADRRRRRDRLGRRAGAEGRAR